MRAQASAAVAAAAILAGCTVGPDYHPPKPDLPPHFEAATNPVPVAQPSALQDWWESFDDPELTSLVARAIKANPDLAVALLRLQEARTEEEVVMGMALPEAGVSGAGGRGTGTDLTRGSLAPPLDAADNRAGHQITQAIGFDAGWELDIFGKFRREQEAAAADSEAAAADRDEVLISTVADVARAYFDLRGLEMRQAVLERDIATAQKTVDLVGTRYDRGLTNELDLTLAQRELATLKAQLEPFSAEIDAARDTIAVLVGAYPEAIEKELAAPGVIPSLPAQVGAGLPVDLLRRRPDIVEAERQVAAASARIGVATADLFPHVALTGAVGWQGLSGGAAGANPFIWSAGASGAWSLLDFGTLDALVDIADLRDREFLVQYKATVLEAVREVDAALSDYRAEQDRLRNLGDALAAGQKSVTLASERYDRGLTDFLNVLDAQRQEYDLEDQYAAAEEQAADSLAALYKGLGGGWKDHQSVPPIRQPQPAVIAAFRRLLDPGANAGDELENREVDSIMAAQGGTVIRLRIYLGEEKREGDHPLYQSIVRQARRHRLAGVTVFRATQGFGRSTRLHTDDVLFSDDLPVVIEIVDLADKIEAFAASLDCLADIGLMTREPTELCGFRQLE